MCFDIPTKHVVVRSYRFDMILSTIFRPNYKTNHRARGPAFRVGLEPFDLKFNLYLLMQTATVIG